MYNFELLALYNNTWGDFDFNATLGGNVYKVNNQTTVTTAQDMQIRDVVALMSFNETSLEQNSYRKQINSVYGAVNVGWKHLVYLDATLRGDQSSTLPIGNNVYVYPSFSGSFVFSELLKQSDLMPYGKFRLSWAQVGSDTDPYQLGLVYSKSKFTYPGYTIGYINNSTMPNKNLKPTKTNSFELGLEMKFLKNRIGLDFTYYTQNSKNQIMGMASSWTSGYNYRLINAGEIENKGIEIALNTRPIELKDFSWDLNLNFSKNSNKVKKLVDGMDMFELEKAAWLDVQVAAKVGENFGAIVGPDFKRNENGDILIDRRPDFHSTTRAIMYWVMLPGTGPEVLEQRLLIKTYLSLLFSISKSELTSILCLPVLLMNLVKVKKHSQAVKNGIARKNNARPQVLPKVLPTGLLPVVSLLRV